MSDYVFRGGYIEGLDGERWWSSVVLAMAEQRAAAFEQRAVAAEAELAAWAETVFAASQEQAVPIPEPGTDMARLLLVNEGMRRELERRREEYDRLWSELQDAQGKLAATREYVQKLLRRLARVGDVVEGRLDEFLGAEEDSGP